MLRQSLLYTAAAVASSVLLAAVASAQSATASPGSSTVEARSACLTLGTVYRMPAPGEPAVVTPRSGGVLPDAPCLGPDYTPLPAQPMTTRQKAVYGLKRTFDPGQIIGPALAAGILMANPKDHYPRDWRQGAGAFGRNYGAGLNQTVTAEFSRATTDILLREDPRYYPSEDRRLAMRAVHAVLFTVIDRSDSGRPRFALSNFAGAAAGGFVGNAYLPNSDYLSVQNGQTVLRHADFTDATHAGQRSLIQFGGFASNNISREFNPEIRALLRRLHLPLQR